MRPIPTFIFCLLLIGVTVARLSFSGKANNYPEYRIAGRHESPTTTGKEKKKLQAKAKAALEFANKNGFNTEYSFLIDMSLPSGSNRFFVYNIQQDTVQLAGLVAHGRCNQDWLEGRRYNNTIGGGCTSLGKYKVGNSYRGSFGLAWKLYGLEKTNSNAFARFVVLHSYEDVPDTETMDEICQSNGCPMVSPHFLKKLEPLIRKSGKPVLLWIYD